MTVLAGNPFGDRDAILLGFVGEHRSRDNIADGPNPRHVRAKLRVHFYPLLFVELDTCFFEREAVGERPAPH